MALRAVSDYSPEQAGLDHLNNADDEVIFCKGERHTFEKLRSGPLPKSVKAIPQHDGSFQLEATCTDCGTVRIRTTLPGGYLDRSVHYSYRHPEGYLAPKGAGLSKADYADEAWRRGAGAQLAKLAKAAERKASRSKTPVA
jgi:hypothetical protein